MGEIRKENLHQSLIEYLDGLGLTEEQVNAIVQVALTENMGILDELNTTNKSSIVAAINELFSLYTNQSIDITSIVNDYNEIIDKL